MKTVLAYNYRNQAHIVSVSQSPKGFMVIIKIYNDC